MLVMKSREDASVNFIHEIDGGILESRFVWRPGEDYFICYLSTQFGCKQACRFCHLTATGQTNDRVATAEEIEMQANAVLRYARDLPDAPRNVSFSFMARGEPLCLGSPLYDDEVFILLRLLSFYYDFTPKFKISTIMPAEMKYVPPLDSEAIIYYSLYSMNTDFRKRWIPKALPVHTALTKLSAWQQWCGQEIVIHFPFIEGANDDIEDNLHVIETVREYLPNTRFNCIRYNSPDLSKSKESTRTDELFTIWLKEFPRSTMVPRVGYDVNASCGMFV